MQSYIFISPHSVDWNGIAGLTKHRGSAGNIKASEQGPSHCYVVQMPTSTTTLMSIFRKRTSGPPLYKIAARLEDVREKDSHFVKSCAGKTKWKCNFTVLSASYFFYISLSFFPAVTQILVWRPPMMSKEGLQLALNSLKVVVLVLQTLIFGYS